MKIKVVAPPRFNVVGMDWLIHLVFPAHFSLLPMFTLFFFLPCRRTLSSRRRGRCSAEKLTSRSFAYHPGHLNLCAKKMNPRANEQSLHSRKTMMTILQAKDLLRCFSKIWKFIDLGKVKSKKEAFLEALRDKKKVHFASMMDTCYLENAELKSKITGCRKAESRSVVTLQKTTLEPTQFLLSKVRLRPKCLPQKYCMLLQDFQIWTDKQLMQFPPTFM